MKLRFLGKESTPTNSPTLYVTNNDSYVVQGWIVTDPAILATLHIDDDETVVEVPANLMGFLANNGLHGEVDTTQPPIVHVKENGNYIVQGPRVLDTEALDQMMIPDHETCIEVAATRMRALLTGA